MSREVAIVTIPGSYAVDALVAEGDFQFKSVDLDGLGLPRYECPYGLPPVASGSTLLLVSGWIERLALRDPALVPRAVVVLRSRFGVLIGLDQMDAFRLGFPDDVMDALDVVLKVNGVYRDRDLYRYPVGALSTDGNWTEKRGAQRFAYKPTNLDKIRLCVPCFIANVPRLRRRTRRLYGQGLSTRLLRAAGDWGIDSLATVAARWWSGTIHFAGALTHPQRADAARLLLASGMPWRGGITGVPAGIPNMSDGDRDRLVSELKRDGLLTSRRSRAAYRIAMQSCGIVLSITGIGELCFRMAEAWASRRTLVCQDLSHVDTMFPFREGENVVYCRPDLSDLVAVLSSLRHDRARAERIAAKGARDWRAWASDSSGVLRAGFAPLYAADVPTDALGTR